VYGGQVRSEFRRFQPNELCEKLDVDVLQWFELLHDTMLLFAFSVF